MAARPRRRRWDASSAFRLRYSLAHQKTFAVPGQSGHASRTPGVIFHWRSGRDTAAGSAARRLSSSAISPAAVAGLSIERKSRRPRWTAHWSWFETGARAHQSNRPGPAGETIEIPAPQQHPSSHKSGFSFPIPGDGRTPLCPSIDTRPCARQPALRACSPPVPAPSSLRTSLPAQPAYPSTEIDGDKDHVPALGSVQVSSGVVRTGRAAQIAKEKSFRKRWSLSITARITPEQGTRFCLSQDERTRDAWPLFRSLALVVTSVASLDESSSYSMKIILWRTGKFLLYSQTCPYGELP